MVIQVNYEINLHQGLEPALFGTAPAQKILNETNSGSTELKKTAPDFLKKAPTPAPAPAECDDKLV